MRALKIVICMEENLVESAFFSPGDPEGGGQIDHRMGND